MINNGFLKRDEAFALFCTCRNINRLSRNLNKLAVYWDNGAVYQKWGNQAVQMIIGKEQTEFQKLFSEKIEQD